MTDVDMPSIFEGGSMKRWPKANYTKESLTLDEAVELLDYIATDGINCAPFIRTVLAKFANHIKGGKA